MNLIIASNNQHKVQEFQSFLESSRTSIISPNDLGIKFEVEESGKSFRENSLIKVKALYEVVKKPCFSDDSGICIEALDNQPGIYSARYGGTHLTDKQRSELILGLLEDGNCINRKAFFFCCITYYDGQKHHFFEGKCEGEIAHDYKGENGFGYDPIFYYPPLKKRFSEIDIKTKNKISHRAKAMFKFTEFLKNFN